MDRRGIAFGGQPVGEKGNRSMGDDITIDPGNLIKTISEPLMATVDQAAETATSDFATEQRQNSSLRQYLNLAQAVSRE